jgi:hypothetical protein
VRLEFGELHLPSLLEGISGFGLAHFALLVRQRTFPSLQIAPADCVCECLRHLREVCDVAGRPSAAQVEFVLLCVSVALEQTDKELSRLSHWVMFELVHCNHSIADKFLDTIEDFTLWEIQRGEVAVQMSSLVVEGECKIRMYIGEFESETCLCSKRKVIDGFVWSGLRTREDSISSFANFGDF